jgi:2-methylisocitrate lyase-like PEP mutase family enzyme
MIAGGRLKARLEQDRILLAPGIHDALTALLAQQAGAEALYLSGAGVAYTRLGLPDMGLATLGETAAALGPIRDRVELPIIVDADNGFGNALNVERAVRFLERSGADAVQLEDQAAPKRCGHLAGKALVAVEEMVGKVEAAVDARRSEDTLVIARTDAIAVEGYAAALERAERYVEAGADILFVEAPESLEQMKGICAAFNSRLPVLANMVEGGASPLLSAAELEAIGFRLAIFPGGAVRRLAHALRHYYRQLLAEGTTRACWPEMLDLEGLNRILGTEDFLARGRRYDPAGESRFAARPL